MAGGVGWGGVEKQWGTMKSHRTIMKTATKIIMIWFNLFVCVCGGGGVGGGRNFHKKNPLEDAINNFSIVKYFLQRSKTVWSTICFLICFVSILVDIMLVYVIQ